MRRARPILCAALERELPRDLAHLVACYLYKPPHRYFAIPTRARRPRKNPWWLPTCLARCAISAADARQRRALESDDLASMEALSEADLSCGSVDYDTCLEAISHLDDGRLNAAAFCMRQAPSLWHASVADLLVPPRYTGERACYGPLPHAATTRLHLAIVFVWCFPLSWQTTLPYASHLLRIIPSWCRALLEVLPCAPDDPLIASISEECRKVEQNWTEQDQNRQFHLLITGSF